MRSGPPQPLAASFKNSLPFKLKAFFFGGKIDFVYTIICIYFYITQLFYNFCFIKIIFKKMLRGVCWFIFNETFLCGVDISFYQPCVPHLNPFLLNWILQPQIPAPAHWGCVGVKALRKIDCLCACGPFRLTAHTSKQPTTVTFDICTIRRRTSRVKQKNKVKKKTQKMYKEKEKRESESSFRTAFQNWIHILQLSRIQLLLPYILESG